MQDELTILLDDERAQDADGPALWDILVVDDDPEVHVSIEFALSQMEIKGRRLRLHHAYSGREACQFIDVNRAINLVLLDAVMETADAGPAFAKHVHESFDQAIRPAIVLRSGQVGYLSALDVEKIPHIDAFIRKADAASGTIRNLLNRFLI